MRFDCLERALCRFFAAHIKLVLRHPTPFLLLPLISTGLFSIGLLRLHEAMLKDELELYTPSDARARRELYELDTLFHINDTDPYYASRRYDLKRTGYIIVTGATDTDETGSGEDILNPTMLKAAAQLWSIIQSITIDQNIDYTSLCVHFPWPNSIDDAISSILTLSPNRSTSSPASDQFCVSNPLLELFRLAMDSSDQQLISQLELNSSSLSHLIPSVSLDSLGQSVRALLGGVSHDAETRRLSGAKALMLPYALRHGTEAEEALAEKWELKLAQFLREFRSPYISANWWTYETLATESGQDRQRLQRWMLPCFAAVSLFTVLLCSARSPVFARPLLALAGIASVTMALASGIGALLALRFPLTSVTLSMPFIIFSVGVDNVFILLAAWRATPPELKLEQRMARTFGDAGVSITITFLTDFLSFTIGCLTPFPSVQLFCLFSAVTLLFSYIYQLTFFAALMALTSMREVQHRHCLTMRKIRSQKFSVHPNTVYSSYDLASSSSQNMALSRFFRSHYASFLLNKFVQAIVLLLFGAYLLVSAYGCMNIELGLKPLDLLPEHSHGKRALRVTEQYFSDYGGHLHVWMRNLSTIQLGHRRLWLVLQKEIELYEHTEFTGAADSWLRTFLHFQHAHGVFTTQQNFVPRLKEFLRTARHRKYRRDIRFTPDGIKLEASRVPIRLRFVGFQNQSRAMHLFRLLAESSELPTGVYADFFMFAEQYNALLPGTISSIGMAGLAVVLVSLLLIPEPMAALWVSFSIVSINLGILGLMPFLALRLDFISMVTIVMSIGFCVDFSAHLAYQYSKTDGAATASSTQRLRNALYAVGTPICQSASTTVLGVSFLASAESYIFRSFLKTIVLVIVLGVLHGLVILPVLLTVVQRKDDDYDDGALTANSGQCQWRSAAVVPWAKKRPLTTTVTEISAPLPTVCNSFVSASATPTAQSPFGLLCLMKRAELRMDIDQSYSKRSTIPIGKRPA